MFKLYKSAQAAGSRYEQSRQRIGDIGVEKSASKEMFQEESRQRQEMFSTIGQSLELVGNIKAKMDTKAKKSKLIESLGKEPYETAMKEAGDDKPTAWEDLSPQEKLKYTPKPIVETGVKGFTQKLGQLIGTDTPKYTYGGKDFEQKDLLAIARHKEAKSLYEQFDETYRYDFGDDN